MWSHSPGRKALLLILLGCNKAVAQSAANFLYSPRLYICQNVKDEHSILIDGVLDDAAWQNAPWTESFMDIEGDQKPFPLHETRCKLLWDDSFLYIGARMEEPHLWATYDQHDMVIFHENDIEVFIDPDRDTHQYMELEINAIGTHWDLLLTKPYRNGGRAVDAWDIRGLRKAVHRQGTVNRPDDIDTAWTVEIAIPWRVLEEANLHPGAPHPGEAWKLNFSRVQWERDIMGGMYQKKTDSQTGKPLPEYNWVWSPQGRIDMHQPETWGLLVFDTDSNTLSTDSILRDDQLMWKLRQVYYAQQNHFRQYGRYFDDYSIFSQEGITGNTTGPLAWVASIRQADSYMYINQEGRVWR